MIKKNLVRLFYVQYTQFIFDENLKSTKIVSKIFKFDYVSIYLRPPDGFQHFDVIPLVFSFYYCVNVYFEQTAIRMEIMSRVSN